MTATPPVLLTPSGPVQAVPTVAVDEAGNYVAPGGGGSGGGGGAATIADGADVAQGARADAAYGGSGSATIVGILKGLYARLAGTLTVALSNLAPTSGVNLSGTATSTSAQFLAANAARRPGDVQGQNVSAVSIGINEFGGTAAIGSPGTYTVPAGATFAITTNGIVNFVAASGTAAVTATGIA